MEQGIPVQGLGTQSVHRRSDITDACCTERFRDAEEGLFVRHERRKEAEEASEFIPP